MKTQEKALVKVETTKLPATASIMVATARNDITIPYYSGAMQYTDEILIQRGGGKGLKIYDEIERDTHAGAMLQKRRTTLVAREWEVLPASDDADDVLAADVVRQNLTALPFDRICEDLLDATLKGFAISEIVWKIEGNRIVADEVVTHDQRRFVFDEYWNPRLLTWTDNRDGIELPERKFVVHRFGVKGNNPYGLGLGSKLFFPVLFKREGIAFWLHFIEKFASPTVVGETPYGQDTSEQRYFLNSLSQLRNNSAFTTPIGSNVKFLEATRSGSVSYRDFCDYWDKQISICVNGETLTTDIGSNGSKAAAETHEGILEKLVDSDGDLLAATVKATLLQWIVDYNVPGARVPDLWWVRPKNEREDAVTRKTKAAAAKEIDAALNAILKTAARIPDDDAAREYITSFDLINDMSPAAIDALVATRNAAPVEPDVKKLPAPAPAFMADPDPLKKKDHSHVCFADGNDPLSPVTDQLLALVEPHVRRRIAAIAQATDTDTAEEAAQNLLKLAARWSPDTVRRPIDQAMELAGLMGREAVFADDEASPEFAATVVGQTFDEQIAFLRQKRAKPTAVWTDAMRGDHDRSFVVAGAMDMALVEDFQEAILKAVETTWDKKEFAADFDRLVEKYGWSYNGGRSWRINTIFKTNIRTSYMAGELQQMRDPDFVKRNPYWQYRHGDLGTPKEPRPQHVAWHELVLRWDDPWWDVHFPPNDWLCSCGVRALSERDLTRLGKTGPDPTPEILRDPIIDKVTGQPSTLPRGVGYGWDYMPGKEWERGLVPSRLLPPEDGGMPPVAPPMVRVDQPESVTDLVRKARPFKAKPLAADLPDEDYVKAFLNPFGADIGNAVLHDDVTGTRLPISDALFRLRDDIGYNIGNRLQATLLPFLTEAILDPDEVWLSAREAAKPGQAMLVRRYIRVDPTNGTMVAVTMGRSLWQTAMRYLTGRELAELDLDGLAELRGGMLLFKRNEK